MRFRMLWLLLPALGALGQNKTPDLCAAPPGSFAPALPAKLLPGQGDIHFPITTANPEAQKFFNQGVAQMHSFWAVEAERSFLQAAALDPQAPMPHWGVAMVAAGDYRPGFQLDYVNGKPAKPKPLGKLQGGMARAVEAAKKAVELSRAPGKATPVEKLYIAAIAARRDVSAKNPHEGYVKGLRAILAHDPGQVEAKSYLALQIMSGFVLPDKKPRSGSMEAAKLLRELLKEAPAHPGVHHYVIHGFEGSTFASDAWPSCRRYPELSSNIAHALHMPGHIYAQTGKWREATQAFESAAANELGWIRADKLHGTGHHGHNVHFLAASHSFNGNYAEAVKTARGLLEFAENPREAAAVDNYRTAWRQGWFALLRTLVQFEKWDEILDGSTLPSYEKPRERAWRHWAMALAHAAKDSPDAAGEQARLMDQALADWKAKMKENVPEALQVARQELDGHLALASGQPEDGLRLLEKAARRERGMRYNEPPAYPRPALQALGQAALRHGRRAVAEKAFREALEQYPESSHAQAGLRAALMGAAEPVDAGR